ncbi:hydrolase [Pyrococcus furiosus DSM 3638]|uniref:Hydrolase n=4 Tax=Pyrococcus furiosus TaxID=2261 RepID=E7FHU9_PYRFU|nr:hydrolase [Pyrococcus furiosus]AKR71455.1 glycosidase PF0444 [synthetic construct]AAG28455.1 alpha-galactosidase [Pyrococcus furiosus DSM 3638]AAL80568.1 hydrolase [Pyrococcus furiosus DSM 3638]AFN03238.1 hydrolase [Pyrococcus furiosus COM1]QEK78158.1 hydrolase [Pyrococcus furiosus DSM 3638]
MRALVFHGNLQYAEIPKSEIPKVIEKAYFPTISELIRREIPFGLNITGYSLSFLPKDLIALIKEGIESGLIEILGTSYTHAILPLLPLSRVEAQIKRDREVKENILEVSPEGFWLPELAYDPIIPAILRDNNYEYLFADGEAMLFSNHLNSAIKPIKPLYPHLIKAQRGEGLVYLNYLLGLRELKKAINLVFEGKVTLEAVKEIEAIPVWVSINTAVMLGAGRFPLMNPKKVAKWVKEKDEILLYGTDIEFLGYRDIAGYKITISNLLEIINELEGELGLPRKIKHSEKKLYLRTSSWAPDKSLRIWTEDEGNARLNMLTSYMDGELAFLAENSDARGWEPLPERRLDAFKAIYTHWRSENGKH